MTFHNGEVFDAAIVKLNVDESAQLRHQFHPGGYLNFHPGLRLEIRDAHTIRFHFPEPDGAVLPKLSFLHIATRQFYRELGWAEKHWRVLDASGPWGTGPYKLMEGTSTPRMVKIPKLAC